MDDLLDLNFTSSTPISSSRPTSTKPNSSFAFDSLSRPAGVPNYYSGASSSSSTLPSRTQTPSTAPISQLARLAQPPRPSSGAGDRVAPSVNSGPKLSNDAFSSLLSLGPSNGNNGKESMAERAKRLEKEKRDQEENEKKQFDNGDFWDRLGGPSANGGSSVRGPKKNGGFSGFDDLLQPSSGGSTSIPPKSASKILAPTPSVPTGRSSKGTFWDPENDLLSSGSTAPTSRSTSSTSQLPHSSLGKVSSSRPPADPFDFDLLTATKPVTGTNGTNGSDMRAPSSDDWGMTEDDILGSLSQPAVQKDVSGSKPRPTRITARPSSPPPHIVGQIVEMGFSPAQARAALAKTQSGLDVSAALELLLGAGTTSQSSDHDRGGYLPPDVEDEEEEDFIQRERTQRETLERERQRARRAGPSRDAIAPRTKDEIRSAHTSGRGTPELGEQAEKYLAQASEIGTNVLSKATSFWAAGKEKAQKLYEEQKRVYEAQQAAKEGRENRDGRERVGAVGGREVKDGRPRWMIDAQAGEADGEEKEQGGATDFRDDDDDEEEAHMARPQRDSRANGSASGSKSTAPPPVEPYRSVKERADLLFADEAQPYVPASRRKAPTASSSSVAPSRSPRPVTPAPQILIQRQIVSANPAQIQRAAAAKAKGNDHFKLGRFSESESAYTAAISSLPTGHLHLIALHNNRAATRLKLGQSSRTVEDSGVVLEIIGPTYHPTKEEPLSGEYSDVRLANAMVKALIKRAQAYEMGEKWKLALEDWERVMGLDAAFLGSGTGGQATKNMAAEGARRSRRMIDGEEPTPAKVPSRPPPKSSPKPVAFRPMAPSTAVKELRQANLAQEQEDAERLRLKDSVEAKLSAWKSGKETNLRALIASLDIVLWESMMSGVRVGMHELISEKQVKIRYMKVIARLHPDKLDVKNTTVEQRMLANGVFGTLNEAWQAFQNGS